MTLQTSTLTADATFDVPTNLIGTTVQVSALGAAGLLGSGAAIVNANIPIAFFPILCYIGLRPDGSGNGGDGFSGGGAGGTTTNGGGGSTGLVSAATATPGLLLLEAAGSDGANVASGDAIHGLGGGAGFAGDPGFGGISGTDIGNGGGGGGSQGGFGGGSAAGSSGTGKGSATAVLGGQGAAGIANTIVPGGTGGPQAGISVAFGVSTSYVSSSLVFLSVGQAGSVGAGAVEFSWHEADAPDVPTLVSPTSGFFDTFFGDLALSASPVGAIFTGTYNTPGADTGPLLACALSLSVDSGDTTYFNGFDFTSVDPVWLLPTTGGGAADGEDFTISVPAGIIPNGHTLDWSLATQEAFAGVQGAFATTAEFGSAAAPVATITEPIGEVNSVTPTVAWTSVIAAGSAAAYRFVVYASPTPTPGAGTPLYDSGVVDTASESFTLTAGLKSGTTYYGYLLVASDGPNFALSWVETTFRPILLGGYDTPTLVPSLDVDPVTGMPAANLTLAFTDEGGTPALVEVQVSVNSGPFVDVPFIDWTDTEETAAIGFDLSSPFNVSLAYKARVAYDVSTQLNFSPFSDESSFGSVQSTYWWIVPPTAPLTAMQLMRLPASGGSASASASTPSPTTPAIPGSLTASLVVDDIEQLGIFRPFGKSTATLIHGDIWADEFDLDLYFDSTESWDAFHTIRDLQDVVLLKSDMEGSLYWVTIGGDLAPGIISRADRQSNPTRGLTVHCTPTDPPS